MADTDSQSASPPANAEATRSEPRFVPPTDIIETGDALFMLLDMPGADPDTLEVTLDRRVLSIAAHSMSSAPEGYTPVFLEYREGNYERKFIVSEDVDSEHIEAELKDGVLRLRLPKTSPSPAKRITVTTH
jgi:HSP20 family molecular chaperone IbpA